MSSVTSYAQEEINKIPGLESAMKIVSTLPDNFFHPMNLYSKKKMSSILQRMLLEEIQYSERMKSYIKE